MVLVPFIVISLLFILDLLLDLPPASPLGHLGVPPIQFRSQRPNPVSCSAGDRLRLPRELPRAQRMALSCTSYRWLNIVVAHGCPEFVRILSPRRSSKRVKKYL